MNLSLRVEGCLFVPGADDGILVAIRPITRMGTNVSFGDGFYEFVSGKMKHPRMRVTVYGNTYKSLVEVVHTVGQGHSVTHNALTNEGEIKRAHAAQGNGEGSQ